MVIGLDVGEKRIGVACGDTEVKMAFPLPPIANDERAITNISKVIRGNHADTVVIGLPRNASGEETAQSVYARNFAGQITGIDNVKVVMQDESLTSVIAEDNLRSRKDFKESMLRDGTLDSEAASLIVTDFLEGENHNNV